MPEDSNEIHIFSADFEEFFARFAEQIGRGEVFVETDESLPVGTPLLLIFNVVYDDLPLFNTNGEVSYIIERNHSDSSTIRAPGMGVKITGIDENIRSCIVELVKLQLKSELSRMFTT